ncbi:MAG: efflux RND transporter periplasmic adaptor subunit [Rhodospirillales bacterium]
MRAPALLLGVALWAAPGSPQPAVAQTPAPPAVVVARAELRDLARQRDFVGRVRAVERVDLRARVEGVLRERRFVEGALVAAGDVLFVIEPDLFEAALDLARAEVAKAEATLADAASQLQRARDLSRSQNIAQASLDQRVADEARARAQVLGARAQQRQAEMALGHATIAAPIPGRIGEAALGPGNLVGPASGALATIVAQDPIHVAFPVAARDLLDAQRRGAAAGGLIVRVRLADGELHPEPGRIDFTDIQADRTTDTVLVRARFANPRGELIDGQTVRVIVEGETPSRALTIPQAALQLDQAGAFVLVVGADDRVAVRRLKVGTTRAGHAAVLEGLAAGERVIVQGIQRVRPGQPVTPSEARPGPRCGDAGRRRAPWSPRSSSIGRASRS